MGSETAQRAQASPASRLARPSPPADTPPALLPPPQPQNITTGRPTCHPPVELGIHWNSGNWRQVTCVTPFTPQFICTVDILVFHVYCSVSLKLTFKTKKKKKRKKNPQSLRGIRNQFQETLPTLTVNAATESKRVLACVCVYIGPSFLLGFIKKQRRKSVVCYPTYCWTTTVLYIADLPTARYF